jgi:hypothetical protein
MPGWHSKDHDCCQVGTNHLVEGVIKEQSKRWRGRPHPVGQCFGRPRSAKKLTERPCSGVAFTLCKLTLGSKSDAGAKSLIMIATKRGKRRRALVQVQVDPSHMMLSYLECLQHSGLYTASTCRQESGGSWFKTRSGVIPQVSLL